MMDYAVAGLLYVYVGLIVALLIGSVVYSYKIMRLVGAIRSWFMMIVGLLLIALESVFSFVRLLLETPSAIASSLEASSPLTLAVGLGYVGAISFLFFGAMFGLHSVFRRSKQG